MFVLGSLPPHEHVCVCLSVRAYVPECIVCACKHASVRVCAWACAWGRMCESVRPSVCLSVCPRACSCVQMFDRTSMRSSMHARVREGVCLSPSVRPSVRLSVCPRACSCFQMFVRTCVRSSMHARHFLFLTSNFLTSNFLLLPSNF